MEQSIDTENVGAVSASPEEIEKFHQQGII